MYVCGDGFIYMYYDFTLPFSPSPTCVHTQTHTGISELELLAVAIHRCVAQDEEEEEDDDDDDEAEEEEGGGEEMGLRRWTGRFLSRLQVRAGGEWGYGMSTCTRARTHQPTNHPNQPTNQTTGDGRRRGANLLLSPLPNYHEPPPPPPPHTPPARRARSLRRHGGGVGGERRPGGYKG